MKILVRATGQRCQHFRHLVSKGPRRYYAILRALELRRGDHFHGLGDLLRILDRLDSPANVQKIRHESSLRDVWPVRQIDVIVAHADA